MELGKWFNRPVSVFDLEDKRWFSWRAGAWQADTPCIAHSTFTGTGTRNLTVSGCQAIVGLFERTFGK